MNRVARFVVAARRVESSPLTSCRHTKRAKTAHVLAVKVIPLENILRNRLFAVEALWPQGQVRIGLRGGTHHVGKVLVAVMAGAIAA